MAFQINFNKTANAVFSIRNQYSQQLKNKLNAEKITQLMPTCVDGFRRSDFTSEERFAFESDEI